MTTEPFDPRPNLPPRPRPARRLVLKFPDRAVMPADPLEATDAFRQTAAGRALAEALPGVRLRPLFGGFPADAMAELVARARTYDPTYVPPSFDAYYAIDLTEAQAPIALDALGAHRGSFDTLYFQYPSPPPPMPSLVNYSYSGANAEHYLRGTVDGMQRGVNAIGVWSTSVIGSDGTDASATDPVLLVDLEMGWALPNNDLGDWDPPVTASSIHKIWGTPRDTYLGEHVNTHGLKALGVVRALDDGVGRVGLTPRARLAVVAQFEHAPVSPEPAGGEVPQTSRAILEALRYMRFGDVLLLEAQTSQSGPGSPLVPVEFLPDVFDVIRLAVATGVVVIEAAGNGHPTGSTIAFDLDSIPALDRGDAANFKDSGAIVVSGCARPTPVMTLWTHSSGASVSYGSRVDCFAQNTEVHTLGLGPFSGTSAASAIIAGVAVAVQGMCQHALGRRIAPETLRGLLADPALGTTAWIDATTPAPLGAMPDLVKIHGVIEDLADVYLRDAVGDTGDPHLANPCHSPDLIVRHAVATDPTAAFGGGHWDTDFCQNVIAGTPHSVYVRVTNRSAFNDATGVSVSVYWAPPSALTDPSQWTPIGETSPAVTVPAGGKAVLGPIPWPTSALPTTPGHNCCLVGLLRSDNEPTVALHEAWQPTAGAVYTVADFVRMVQLNNNVAWRNVDVIAAVVPENVSPDVTAPSTRTGIELPFRFSGVPSEAVEMELILGGSPPPEAELWLTGPVDLLRGLAGWRVEERLFGDALRAAVKLSGDAREGALFRGRVKLAAKSENLLGLFVQLPPKAHRKTFEVFASQGWRGVELGRLTWRFESPKKPAKKPAKKPVKGGRGATTKRRAGR